jgi:hypothetical protein
MNLAQTRQRRGLYVFLSLVFIFAGVVGSLMGLLKHLYGLEWRATQIATGVAAIWWVPGIPWLWQHASLGVPGHPNAAWSVYLYVCFGLIAVGGGFRFFAGHLSHYIRQSAQDARVERLKRERLGDTHPPGSRIMTATGGTFHGSFIGDVTGGHAQINYTSSNDLAAISPLVNETLSRVRELPLTPFQRVQFKTQLDAIQKECTSPAPNYTLLRKALGEVGHTVRHLAEAGTAHVLVSHWQQIWHALQR